MDILDDIGLRDILEKAKTHFEEKEFNATIACCKKALEFDNENPEAFLHIGMSLFKCEKYIEARDYFEKLISITPDNDVNISWLADTYLKLREYGKSATTIGDALKINPADKDYLFISAVANYYEKNLDKSTDAFEKLTKIEPKNYIFYKWLGNVFTYKGNRVDDYSIMNGHNTSTINTNDEYEKALEYYHKANELSNYTDGNVRRLYGKILIINGKYKEAIDSFNGISNKDEYYAEMLIAKAEAFTCINDHKLALDCYFNAIQADKPLLLALLKLIESEYEKSVKDKIIKSLDILVPDIEYCDEKYRYTLKHIIKETANIALGQKGEARYHLLCLVNKIDKIKSLLKYPYSGVKGRDIAHYTKLNTLKCLVGANGVSSKLRLQNVAYMNDPSEGTILWKLLDNLSSNTDGYFEESFLSGKSQKDMHYRNTYLASFSEEKNKLPLWTQYADDANGCCIVFDSNYFDERDESFVGGLYYNPDNDKENDNFLAEEYCLYKVFYVDASKDGVDQQDKKNLSKFDEISSELKEIIKIMENLKSLNLGDTDIMSLALSLIDQIRFLFKSKDYEHEKELRIVKFPNKSMVIADSDNFRVPHLYIEIDKEIKIKEVVLGPKVQRMSEIVPFVLFNDKVESISVSDIQYQ